MKHRIFTIISVLALCMLLAPNSFGQYCTTGLYQSACVDDDYVQSFSTTGGTTNISNLLTGCGNTTTGYTYYSTQPHTGLQGGTVNFKIVNTPVYDEFYKIWVDWNADNDFLDAGEQVYSGFILEADSVSSSFVIPVTATAGTKRLRVRCVYDPTPFTACSLEDYGEIEDYNLTVSTAPPCAGTPTPGTAAASVTAACPGVPFTLSLTGTTAASGLIIQWQSKPSSSSTWTNITGANTASYSIANQTVATDYQATVSCGTSISTSNMISVGQNSFSVCYCSPLNGTVLVSQGNINEIFSVAIPTTTLNAATTTTPPNGYTQVPATPASNTATLNAGSTYTLNASIEMWVVDIAAWIDYNQNGIFDASEKIPMTITPGTTTATASATFTVPATAAPGATGMRLAASEWTSITTACADVIDGEVEDYVITVTNASGCAAPTGLNATAITASSATLGWTAVPGATGYQYLVDQNAGSPVTAGTATTAVTFNATALNAATTYYLHVRAVCGGTNFSTWSNYAFTTTTTPCNAPMSITATAITGTTASIAWTAATGAIGYEYSSGTSATPPSGAGTATNTTTASLTALTPNTTYYVHVRTKCTATNFSTWTTYSFTTPTVTAGCSAPSAVTITGIGTTGVQFTWPAVSGSVSYEYAVTNSTAAPSSVTNVTTTTVNKTGLVANTVYYIHLRSRCGATVTSGWTIKQFSTVATGVNTVESGAFAVNAYPNPVTSVLHVKLEGKAGKNAQVILTDLSGRAIISMPVTGSDVEVNTSALSQGLYLLNYSDDQRRQTLKIEKR
jgi:hypothetical protein